MEAGNLALLEAELDKHLLRIWDAFDENEAA
jgi:hypothetical protein